MSTVTRQCPVCRKFMPVVMDATTIVCPNCRRGLRHAGTQLLSEASGLRWSRCLSAPLVGASWQMSTARYEVVATMDWWDEEEEQLSTEFCLRAPGNLRELWLERVPDGPGRRIWWRYRTLGTGLVSDTPGGAQYDGMDWVADGPLEVYTLRGVAGSFTETPEIGEQDRTQWYKPTTGKAAGRQALLGRSEEDGGKIVWYLLEPIEPPPLKHPTTLSPETVTGDGARPRLPPLQAEGIGSLDAESGNGAWYGWIFLLAAMLAVLLHLMTSFGGGGRVYDSGQLSVRDSAHWISPSFRIDGGTSNVQSRVNATVSNRWASADACLINVGTARRYCIRQLVEYYYGTDHEGAWQEGATRQESYFSSVPAGTYRLELNLEAENPEDKVQVLLYRDVPRHRYLALALLLLSAPPLFLWALKNPVEKDGGGEDHFTLPFMLAIGYVFLIYQAWP